MMAGRLAAAVLCLALTACQGGPPIEPVATSSSLAPTEAPQPSVMFKGVLVPPGAQREPPENVAPDMENWDVPGPFAETAAAEQALLPIGKPLGRLPWCGPFPLPARPGQTGWIWGTARNGLAVLVVGDPNESAIVIHHTGSAIGYCKWPGPGR
jgi:hypothetical protein